MLTQEQIKVNINSLTANNNILLAEIKRKARSIETKNLNTEEYNKLKSANVLKKEPVSKVDFQYANITYNSILDIEKKIKENIAAINILLKQLQPEKFDAKKAREYAIGYALQNRMIRCGKINYFTCSSSTAYTDNEYMFSIQDNCNRLNLSTVVILISYTDITGDNFNNIYKIIDSFKLKGISVVLEVNISSVTSSNLLNVEKALYNLFNISAEKSLRMCIINGDSKSDFDTADNLVASVVENAKNIYNGLICFSPYIGSDNTDIFNLRTYKNSDIVMIKTTNPNATYIQTVISNINKKYLVYCTYEDLTYYNNMYTIFKDDKNMIGFCVDNISGLYNATSNKTNPVGSNLQSTIATFKFNR